MLSTDSDKPDTLELGLDQASYAAGDTVKLRIVPRYDGKAQIHVMNNHLIQTQWVAVVEGENIIELDVTEKWGAGAYVSATVIRPMNVSAGHNPARSLGLA